MRGARSRGLICAAGGLLLATACALHGGAARAEAGLAETRAREAVESYTRAMQSTERDVRLQAFARAEQLFRAAAAAGARNAELQTSLGNAALQAEHLGPAIAAYRRALLMDPGQAAARQNLAHARRLLPDWIPTPPEAALQDSIFFWHRALSRDAREGLAALVFLLGAVLLAASIHLARPALRQAAIVPGAAWVLLLVSLALDPARDASQQAVVVVPEALARAADSINAPRRFSEPLPDGTELEILENRGGWLHIKLHNGRDAWLTSSSVERIAGDDPPGDP